MLQSNSQERAMFFIDGSNWYHALRNIQVVSSEIDYQSFAHKLALPCRHVVEVRYYVGKVSGDLISARNQERFLSLIKAQGVKVVLGRVEKKQVLANNQVQKNLHNLLSRSGHCITDAGVLTELRRLASQPTYSYTEKRVDVSLAVDMIAKAMNNAFDVAYIISSDGDFVPAVEAVKEMGKKVFAANASRGRELGKYADRFILLKPEWFSNNIFRQSAP